VQGGRITVGFLGGTQVDRFANVNRSVIGNYSTPKVRLPGSGRASEIATGCAQIFILMKQDRRSL
jgi:glutaconate CoA-transferase, subunit B